MALLRSTVRLRYAPYLSLDISPILHYDGMLLVTRIFKMAAFDTLEEAPGDPILDLTLAFKNDERKSKINLGVGAYKDSEGSSLVFNCVRQAEQQILDQRLDKEYPPIQGLQPFIEASIELVFGKDCDTRKIFGAQTLGGTGALRIAGEFLAKKNICSTIFLSDPTWGNHLSIFHNAGLKLDTYNYYDSLHKTVDFQALCNSVQQMPQNSAILLQPCCHNPTGTDLSFPQWEALCLLIKEKQVFPFFDLAYQGFDQGLEEDAKVIRMFAKHHPEMIVASSYSKNMGLYGERIGHLAICTENEKNARAVGSQVKQLIRSNYSMPPLYSGRIVSTILNSESLRNEWIKELANVRERIQEMRKQLVSGLIFKGGGRQFDYLADQTGMFSFSGINPEQACRLKSEQGIYMLKNGRINIAGLNAHNLDYFIDAILSVKEPS